MFDGTYTDDDLVELIERVPTMSESSCGRFGEVWPQVLVLYGTHSGLLLIGLITSLYRLFQHIVGRNSAVRPVQRRTASKILVINPMNPTLRRRVATSASRSGSGSGKNTPTLARLMPLATMSRSVCCPRWQVPTAGGLRSTSTDKKNTRHRFCRRVAS